MTAETRRKLSLAFTIYNQSRAEARRRGDIKKVELMNKVLGNLVKNAFRPAYRPRPATCARWLASLPAAASPRADGLPLPAGT